MRKVCTKCNVEKELKDFYKEKKGKYGVRSKCIDCFKKYFDENKNRISEVHKEYYQKNKERISKTNRQWEADNKEKVREYRREWEKERMQNDPVFRMIKNYRHRTRKTYKNKSKSTIELLGCTGIELANHLEKQFQEGMTHDNYGEWHIDHIKPIASFDLSDPKEAEKCFHYTNLQPLWAADNLSKGHRQT